MRSHPGVNCSSCGATLGAALIFCGECGARVASPPAEPDVAPCPVCADPVPLANRFCGSCGAAVPRPRAAEPARPLVDPSMPPPRAAVGRPALAFDFDAPAPAPATREEPPLEPAPVPARGTVPAPASFVAKGPRCIACSRPIDPLARTCPTCGVFQVLLAPEAVEVAIPPPPSARGGRAGTPSSVPPPAATRGRPALEALEIPPGPRVPADLTVPPAPRPIAPWRIVLVQNDGAERTLSTFEKSLEVGRKATAALAEDRFVSPRHVRFTPGEDGVHVEDLGSVNGVFLRVDPHAPTPLASGDVILLGAQVLRVELLDGKPLPGVITNETNVFGVPAKPRLARLVEVTCDGVPRSTYVISSESTLIGRESADIVFADDPHLSRRHAEIRIVGGRAELVDLASSNGSYVRLREASLVPSGAQLRIGQQRVRVEHLENRGGA